ncbi:TetR/AcrR family transcriptional regulator [Methylocapsa sp. S129]|uniref:TetR/AcrR family transcriptional regulator n=1 Tax=Methylocapsa sp. S129 TaxID=1641869 RepID=UPI00131B6162|nr:TetR/AcrR family transcriptional regulator [Methylocapsa sp. S129]
MKHSPKSIAPISKGAAAKAPRSAGRPRSEGARRAVLDAAYAILVETGLGKFSTEAVALRSGVARTTIYRWWPSKGLLAIESFLEAFRPQLIYAETGDAIADFRALVSSLARALSGPAGRIAASVVAQAQSDPETRQMFLETFSKPLRHESSQLLARGVKGGDFRADLNAPLVLDAIVGAIYLRLLLGQPLDARWSRALSDTILRGCLGGPAIAMPGGVDG